MYEKKKNNVIKDMKENKTRTFTIMDLVVGQLTYPPGYEPSVPADAHAEDCDCQTCQSKPEDPRAGHPYTRWRLGKQVLPIDFIVGPLIVVPQELFSKKPVRKVRQKSDTINQKLHTP